MESNSTFNQHDEIATFLEARYVSAPEAYWRLAEYSMHRQSHTVIRLPVHLHQEQNIYFNPGEEEEALAEAEDRSTMLTAWFKLNSSSDDARHLLYTEIPQHYVFQRNKKAWVARKIGAKRIVPRMYSVSARDTERFFLRILLLHVKGATSYEYLRTVDG